MKSSVLGFLLSLALGTALIFSVLALPSPDVELAKFPIGIEMEVSRDFIIPADQGFVKIQDVKRGDESYSACLLFLKGAADTERTLKAKTTLKVSKVKNFSDEMPDKTSRSLGAELFLDHPVLDSILCFKNKKANRSPITIGEFQELLSKTDAPFLSIKK